MMKNSINKNTIFNRITLLLTYAFIVLFFGMKGDMFIFLTIVYGAMFVSNIDCAIGTFLSLYILVASDYYALMLIPSPFGKFPFYIVVYVFAIGVNLLRRCSRNTTWMANTPLFIAGFMILISGLITYMIFGENVIISNSVKFFFHMFGMIMLINVKNLDRHDIEKLLHFVFFLVALSLMVAVLEGFFGYNVYELFGKEKEAERYAYDTSINLSWRVSGTFGNCLVFSSSMVMTFPVIEYFRRVKEQKVISYVALTVLFIGVALSGSRSGLIACVIYLGYMLIATKKGRWVALIAVPVLLYLVLTYVDLTTMAERIASNGYTSEHRVSSYALWLNLILKYLIFGTGLGNSYLVLNNYVGAGNFVVNTLDNTFLDGSLALGLWGSIAVFFSVREFYRKNKRDKYWWMFTSICFVFISLFLNSTRYQSLWGMLWFYYVISVKLQMDNDSTIRKVTLGHGSN